jgi:hypothetical protein
VKYGGGTKNSEIDRNSEKSLLSTVEKAIMLDAGKTGLQRLDSLVTAANPIEMEMSEHAPQLWSDKIFISAESAIFSWEEL